MCRKPQKTAKSTKKRQKTTEFDSSDGTKRHKMAQNVRSDGRKWHKMSVREAENPQKLLSPVVMTAQKKTKPQNEMRFCFFLLAIFRFTVSVWSEIPQRHLQNY